MKNHDDLVLSYYAAVDTKDSRLEGSLFGMVIEVIKRDKRVLNGLRNLEIDLPPKKSTVC